MTHESLLFAAYRASEQQTWLLSSYKAIFSKILLQYLLVSICQISVLSKRAAYIVKWAAYTRSFIVDAALIITSSQFCTYNLDLVLT